MMETLKKLATFMRTFNACSAEVLADILDLLAAGKAAEEVALALNEREGEFPQWRFGVVVENGVRKLRAHANYYDALSVVHLNTEGMATYAEFGTVSGHGVSVSIEATGDVYFSADGLYSSRFWGDALEGEEAEILRSLIVNRRFHNEELPTFDERKKYFLRYAMSDTVGRGIRNVLIRFAKEEAQKEFATVASIDAAVMGAAYDLGVWGSFTEADKDYAIKEGVNTLHRLEVKAKAEAEKAWHDECLARQADRKNIPGTRAWRRQQRKLGKIA